MTADLRAKAEAAKCSLCRDTGRWWSDCGDSTCDCGGFENTCTRDHDATPVKVPKRDLLALLDRLDAAEALLREAPVTVKSPAYRLAYLARIAAHLDGSEA